MPAVRLAAVREAYWRVYKKKKGFYLWASEQGESQRPLQDNI